LPQDEPIDLLNVAFENPRAIATAKLERQKVLERAAKNKGKNANKRGKGRHQPIEETQSDLLPPSEATHTNGAISELPIEDTTSIYDVPDRITGRETVEELRKIHPEREWRFVEINVEYQVSMFSAFLRPLINVIFAAGLSSCQADSVGSYVPVRYR
jgi:hypothetical protein